MQKTILEDGEGSLFFIKPEAVSRADEIRARIEYAGLKVVVFEEFIMTEELLGSLYEGKSDEVMEKLRKQMLNKKCVLGQVFGECAIERLLDITGRDTDPKKCPPGTIRHDFGDRGVPNQINLNAIHRPKNKEEVVQNLSVFSK